MKKFLVVLELGDLDWKDFHHDRDELAAWIIMSADREILRHIDATVYDDSPLSLYEAMIDLEYDPEEIAWRKED